MYQFIINRTDGSKEIHDFETIDLAQAFFDENFDTWSEDNGVSYAQFVQPEQPNLFTLDEV